MTEEKFNLIIDVVSDITGIDSNIIKSTSKKREVVDARRMLAYVFTYKLGVTHMKTGELLGFNHCSSIYHCKKHKDFMKFDALYKETYTRVETKLSNLYRENKLDYFTTEEMLESYISKLRKYNTLLVMLVEEIYKGCNSKAKEKFINKAEKIFDDKKLGTLQADLKRVM